ncbi:integrating conjugative element protein [Azotobacter chroococcum]|uniref:Integrating conjugative element protein n=1 Tax=Azotobacter chroococcum TaxID=353 RepID=A0AAQ0C0B2_9GAMM|nr:integrating conjugative element protein [Azotobacter chroococcum]QQE89879.1 integrating conjugative element protein [Azotobacter chroococcum]
MTAMILMNTWRRRMLCCVLAGLLPACTSVGPGPGERQSGPPKQAASLAPWEAEMFPVVSWSLSPGPVESRAIDAPGLRPVFLVGDDSLSRSWLRLRRDRLRRLNALGLVVNVASPAGLAELRRLAEGLRLIPVTGDDLAALLGFSHYPVLVTSTYIEQ